MHIRIDDSVHTWYVDYEGKWIRENGRLACPLGVKRIAFYAKEGRRLAYGGIRAKDRGDISFSAGRLEKALLYTDSAQERILYMQGKHEIIHLEPGAPYVMQPE